MKNDPRGYLCFVLHAHLPYVREPKHERFLEEGWFYEALTETYLPLLEVFEGLWDEGIDFRVSMTLSPPLISMLNDKLLRDRYSARIRDLIQLAQEERDRHDGHVQYLANFYVEFFERRLEQWESRYDRECMGPCRLRAFSD